MMTRKILILLSIIAILTITGLYSVLVFKDLNRNEVVEHPEFGLPLNYTLENYTVEKVLGTACRTDHDCETPPEYMMMSRCPMRAICIKKVCAVVCPDYRDVR
jgi:hypothetical protein